MDPPAPRCTEVKRKSSDSSLGSSKRRSSGSFSREDGGAPSVPYGAASAAPPPPSGPSAFHDMLMGRGASLSSVCQYQPSVTPMMSMPPPPSHRLQPSSGGPISLSALHSHSHARPVPHDASMSGAEPSWSPFESVALSSSASGSLHDAANTRSDATLGANPSLLLTALSSWKGLGAAPPYQGPDLHNMGSHPFTGGAEPILPSLERILSPHMTHTVSAPHYFDSAMADDDLTSSSRNTSLESGRSRSSGRGGSLHPPDDGRDLPSWELSLDHRDHSYAISTSFVSPAALEQETQGRSSGCGWAEEDGPAPPPRASLGAAERRSMRLLLPGDWGAEPARRGSANSQETRETRYSMNSRGSMETTATSRQRRKRRRNAIVGPLMFGLESLVDMEEGDDEFGA